MDDLLLPGLTGRGTTLDDVEAARRHLAALRSLHAEVRATWPSLVPPPPGAWRSMASEGYAGWLDDLGMRLTGAAVALADAEAALEAAIRRTEWRLEVQARAAATSSGSSATGRSDMTLGSGAAGGSG
jgi:hypothetical protein